MARRWRNRRGEPLGNRAEGNPRIEPITQRTGGSLRYHFPPRARTSRSASRSDAVSVERQYTAIASNTQ
eukprot:3436366-Pleurochrysis_carterae.AAC.1